jgi:thiol-disulfide isomerase/thioredoxin
MLRKILLALIVVTAVLAAIGYALYAGNVAPDVAPVSAEQANSGKPYVVKMHAQWCAVCMVTKKVWTQIENSYAGRVNLVVLDFTNDANTDASRREATRLGLEKLYEEYGGATGTVVILDGRKQVMASINGSRDFTEYRTAIDAALKQTSIDGPEPDPLTR